MVGLPGWPHLHVVQVFDLTRRIFINSGKVCKADHLVHGPKTMCVMTVFTFMGCTPRTSNSLMVG